jgi:hypothetical protein
MGIEMSFTHEYQTDFNTAFAYLFWSKPKMCKVTNNLVNKFVLQKYQKCNALSYKPKNNLGLYTHTHRSPSQYSLFYKHIQIFPTALRTYESNPIPGQYKGKQDTFLSAQNMPNFP